jgi:hypothetical protein
MLEIENKNKIKKFLFIAPFCLELNLTLNSISVVIFVNIESIDLFLTFLGSFSLKLTIH